MKRLILIALIGYILGILWGLYFKSSIAFFYFTIIAIYFIRKKLLEYKVKRIKKQLDYEINQRKKLRLFSVKRYLRYIKLYINHKIFLFIMIISIISNTIIIYQNYRYDNLYKEENLDVFALVVSEKIDKEYNSLYKVKVIKVNNSFKYKDTHIYISISKKTKKELKYGDIIHAVGIFEKPSTARNQEGFDYSRYLKTLKIYGTLRIDEVELVKKNEGNAVVSFFNSVNRTIKNKISQIFPEELSGMILGILLGDKTNIEKNVQENFRDSSVIHILSVSGMHVSYIILGIEIIFKKICGKKISRIIMVIFLVIYMFMTGFSPSIVRAGIMGILMLLSKLLYRKNDIATTISFSLLCLLIYNPYLLLNIGLQLSYLGTLGIILFHKNIFKLIELGVFFNIRKFFYRISVFLKYTIKDLYKCRISINNIGKNNSLGKLKNEKKHKVKLIILKNLKYAKDIKIKLDKKYKLFYIDTIFKKLNEILSVTISAQIGIFPIMVLHFNTFGIYFIFTNMLVSFIIGPILIFSIIILVISFVNLKLAKFFSIFDLHLVKLLICISDFANLPFSKIYLATPKVWHILIYYIFIIILNKILKTKVKKSLNSTDKRIKNLLEVFKYKRKVMFKNSKKKIVYIVIIIYIFNLFLFYIPKNLQINFIDVGQGDSTFIVTPKNKTILIDGGGSLSNSYDVGKQTVVPYILDRGYTIIDMMIISHFDNDHVRSDC